MNTITNLRTVDTVHNIRPFTNPIHALVRESGTGYRLPAADAYARRIAEEAEAWLDYTRERSRMEEATLVRKSLDSVAFTFRHRAHNLAVPSKLVGTSKHQPALWRLIRNGVGFGETVDIKEIREDGRVRLVASYEGEALGEIQSKHVRWLAPLVPFGAGVHLVRITGQEEGYTLGCNIAFSRTGSAVAALLHALGFEVGGDGYGGDGAAQAAEAPAPSESRPLPASGTPVGGDGAAADPEAELGIEPGADASDVVLYRSIGGAAYAALGARQLEHVVRHSPTGIEWGYDGSGPADLARSILLAFTDVVTANRLYQRFKAEVVASIPKSGGVIRAVDVRTWIATTS